MTTANGQKMNSEILDRIPPQSVEDERNVLGSILHNQKVLDDVARIVRPEDFYTEANSRIFQAMLDMQSAHKPIDIAILRDWLRTSGEIEAIGGTAYLGEIAIAVPYAFNAPHYAAIVKRKAQRRAMIHAATQLLRNAWDDCVSEAEALSEADRSLTEIVLTGDEREGWTAQEAVLAAFDNIDETIAKGETSGFATGFRTFDEEIGGLFPGELSILGARSAIGKTAMAMQIAQWNAARGRLVYFVTLEMTMLNLMLRELCAAAEVNSVRLRTGKIEAPERERIRQAGEEIATRALVIDDRPTMKTSDIMRKARQLARQGLKIVIVDYTQFVTPDDGRAVREQQVARISKDLKAIAKELKVAVLALSTLNKDAEKQGSAKLSHIRESDGVGYTADVVMTLERGDKGSTNENDAFLKVLKNRNGPIGKFEMDWIPHATRFACKAEQVPDPVKALPTNRHTEFDSYSGF
jgi:replicative DNA helicase